MKRRSPRPTRYAKEIQPLHEGAETAADQLRRARGLGQCLLAFRWIQAPNRLPRQRRCIELAGFFNDPVPDEAANVDSGEIDGSASRLDLS